MLVVRRVQRAVQQRGMPEQDVSLLEQRSLVRMRRGVLRALLPEVVVRQAVQLIVREVPVRAGVDAERAAVRVDVFECDPGRGQQALGQGTSLCSGGKNQVLMACVSRTTQAQVFVFVQNAGKGGMGCSHRSSGTSETAI